MFHPKYTQVVDVLGIVHDKSSVENISVLYLMIVSGLQGLPLFAFPPALRPDALRIFSQQLVSGGLVCVRRQIVSVGVLDSSLAWVV